MGRLSCKASGRAGRREDARWVDQFEKALHVYLSEKGDFISDPCSTFKHYFYRAAFRVRAENNHEPNLQIEKKVADERSFIL